MSVSDMAAYPNDPGYTFTPTEVGRINSGWLTLESAERRAELEAQMPTYRAPMHALYTSPRPDAPGINEFQQAARAAHRAAGDYNRYAVQSGSVY